MTALPPPAGGPLDLDPEELRRLGHWVVDRTVEHLTTLRDRPAITTASYDDLVAVLGGALPVDRRPVEEGLELLADVALEHQQHGDHPRYFARVPGLLPAHSRRSRETCCALTEHRGGIVGDSSRCS